LNQCFFREYMRQNVFFYICAPSDLDLKIVLPVTRDLGIDLAYKFERCTIFHF